VRHGGHRKATHQRVDGIRTRGTQAADEAGARAVGHGAADAKQADRADRCGDRDADRHTLEQQ
jgi:hypothetical protein